MRVMKKSRFCPQRADTYTGARARRPAWAWLSVFLVLLSSFSVLAAEFTLKFTVPPRVEFYLSTDYVDLGLPQTAGGVTYFKGDNVVTLSFRTNITSGWEIHISGKDFRSTAGASIPISRLQWKMGQMEGYRFMRPEGESFLVMDWRNFTGDILAGQRFPVSYYLELAGDEYEGVYTTTITYTLFIP